MNRKKTIGICPVCQKGEVVHKTNGYRCSNHECSFGIRAVYNGLPVTEEMAKDLIEKGMTEELSFKAATPYKGRLKLENGQVKIFHEKSALNGKCPKCGGKVVITGKGYACENALGEKPSCDFFVRGLYFDRKIHKEEVELLLQGKHTILDGLYAYNTKNAFAGFLNYTPEKGVYIEQVIGKCPKCGGEMFISKLAICCSKKCGFNYFWRNIQGHELSFEEIQEMLEHGITKDSLQFFKEDGTPYYKRLAFDGDHKIIML